MSQSSARFYINGPYKTDSQTVLVAPEIQTRIMQVMDESGNRVGIEFNADGTMKFGTWDADGEWIELTLYDHNTFGQPFVAHLDRYKGETKS